MIPLALRAYEDKAFVSIADFTPLYANPKWTAPPAPPPPLLAVPPSTKT